MPTIKPSVPKKNKWKIDLLIATLVVLFIGAIIFLTSGGGTIVEKTKFEQYLNEKYGQAFIVGDVHVRGAGLGSKGAWTAEAYPKSDPSIKFRIDRSQTTGKISVDTFLQTLWTKQGTGEVEAFLSKEFPNNEGYVLEITPGSTENILYDSIKGTTPSLSTALREHRNQISYSLSVRNVVKTEPNEPSDAQLENALKIVDFVKAKNIALESYAYYNYRDRSYSQRDDTGRQQYQYGIQVGQGNLNGINAATDLTKYFKVLN